MTARAVNALNLAYWIYKIHPELFARLQQAAASSQPGRFGALGDDGVTTTFDTSGDVTAAFDAGGSSDTSSLSGSISPDLSALPMPDIADYAGATPNFSIDTTGAASDGGFFSSIGSGLSSVASFLTSGPGLSAVTGLATAIYKSNTPQQSAVATQVARVQNGVLPAPITYGYNSAGQYVPILQPANTAGIALSPSSLAQLVPSSLRPYALPAALGLTLWWLLSGRRRR